MFWDVGIAAFWFLVFYAAWCVPWVRWVLGAFLLLMGVVGLRAAFPHAAWTMDALYVFCAAGMLAVVIGFMVVVGWGARAGYRVAEGETYWERERKARIDSINRNNYANYQRDSAMGKATSYHKIPY